MKQHFRRRTLVACALALALLAQATTEAAAVTPKQLANKVLKLDPRKPSDINLFTSKWSDGTRGFYPSGSPMVPDDTSALGEQQVRKRLRAFLKRRLSRAQTNAALRLFDNPDVRAMIGDPNYRAAVVGMKGTVLEPAINFGLKSGRFGAVRSGGLPESVIATSSEGSPRSVIVNRRYEREDFRYLIGIMGHEYLHDDLSTPPGEEAILNSLSAMTYLQVLSTHPELAYARTELSRQMNDLALLFLNSREDGSSNSEIYARTGRGVAPGSPRNEPDMWSIFDGNAADSSPAHSTFGRITRNLGLRSASRFSLATAKKFAGLNDKWLSDVGRVQISVLLQMISVKQIAKVADLSSKQVKRKLRLGPYLDAIR